MNLHFFDWLSWENPVALWWGSLTLASIVNIFFWYWTLRFQQPKNISLCKERGLFCQKNLIYFSGVYVLVCAFRSIVPRADVQRICLWDSWFSSVAVGRTVATFGELAFVAQWYIVIFWLAKKTESKLALKISKLIIPLIVIAEICSWYAVITTHYIGNTIEESLWALTYFLIGIALFDISKKLLGSLLLSARFSIFGAAFYVLFMVTIDVPMYYQRWQADILSQKPYLGFWDGIIDLNTRWIVTYSIQDWKTEIPWQTLYFTIAVLISIALCYLPLDSKRLQKFLKPHN